MHTVSQTLGHYTTSLTLDSIQGTHDILGSRTLITGYTYYRLGYTAKDIMTHYPSSSIIQDIGTRAVNIITHKDQPGYILLNGC